MRSRHFIVHIAQAKHQQRGTVTLSSRPGHVDGLDDILPGGDLRIRWPDDGAEVIMAGPAAFVFEGEWRQ